MEISHPNRVRVNSLIILFYGLVLLSAALFIFLFILNNVHGRYNSVEIVPSEEILKIFESSKKHNVDLLNSKYGKNILPEGSTRLSDDSTAWVKLIIYKNIYNEYLNKPDNNFHY